MSKFENKVNSILDVFATKERMGKREFKSGTRNGVLLFDPDMSDSEAIREILFAVEHKCTAKDLDDVKKSTVYNGEITKETEKTKIIESLLSGDAALAIEGSKGWLIINVRKYEKRSVMEPPTEAVTKGPREGFIEDLKTNLSLIERRLRTPALAIEKFIVGKVSNTTVAMLYISTIVQPELVEKIRKKINTINIDSLVDSHYLQPLLEPHPLSLFHQTGVTEKPDIVVAKMLEGRIVLLVDGSPMAITIPFLFIEDFQNSQDYYERHSFSTFLRFIRYISIIIAVLLPGLYVALQVFHYDVIPLRFLVTLMDAIKGIPLSPVPEILFVILLFEIIREASVRMPRAVGMAMSIVGGLVLGETAVNAGVISSPSVMFVALSSIALYAVPNDVGIFSILRVVFVFAGGLAGLFGLLYATMFVLFYIVSLDSFGTPFMAPFAPLVFDDLKDALVKRPLLDMKKRPKSISNINETRQK